MIPRPASSSITWRPFQVWSALWRLMARPAPWQDEENDNRSPSDRPDQDVRGGAHRAADQHRLADRAQAVRQIGMSWPQARVAPLR
jgi:hypothetical protein